MSTHMLLRRNEEKCPLITMRYPPFLFFSEIIGLLLLVTNYMSPVKRICVFEHSVMTNFNCACPAIQRGQGSGFLSEGSS